MKKKNAIPSLAKTHVRSLAGHTGSAPRGENTRQQARRMLIYCEGLNTERSYFEQFRVAATDIDVFGEGRNTVSLVRRAIELRDKAKRRPYDEVWCVFDKDDFPQFNAALQLAAAHNIRVAWSNQAFEYWLLLHFEDHAGGAMHRNEYHHRLNRHLVPFEVRYAGKGSKLISPPLFAVLQSRGRQAEAIYRAERNLHQHHQHGGTPSDWESCTTVYQLVLELVPGGRE